MIKIRGSNDLGFLKYLKCKNLLKLNQLRLASRVIGWRGAVCQRGVLLCYRLFTNLISSLVLSSVKRVISLSYEGFSV